MSYGELRARASGGLRRRSPGRARRRRGDAGGGGWLRLHLQPGSYVATCFVPDDEPPHLPHGAMGMDVAFTIR